MSNISQFTNGGVKSVQRRDIVITTGNASASDSITSVNTAKSTLQILGIVANATAVDIVQHSFIPSFTSSTLITVTRYSGALVNVTVSVQVVEYY